MIPGIEIEAGADAVWVRSQAPLRVLSSALVGGGLGAARHILNLHVPKGYDCVRPADDLVEFARRVGVHEPFVGLMTAARTHEAVTLSEAGDGIGVTVVATVGLGGAVAAGLSGLARWRASTINLIAVLDARLEPAAAANGIATVTEAKVGALLQAGIRTTDGLPATGTLTDAVVIAWTNRGTALAYLGPAAAGGWLLARAVRRAMATALARRHGSEPGEMAPGAETGLADAAP
jgi:iron complex transport system ATP-binding protein